MDSYLSLALVIISSLGFSSAFWLGGSSNDGKVRFHEGSQFEKNANVYAHLVIPPWSRPFKPGYCKSWEWHTDKKYRDKRVAICKQYAEGKFMCSSLNSKIRSNQFLDYARRRRLKLMTARPCSVHKICKRVLYNCRIVSFRSLCGLVEVFSPKNKRVDSFEFVIFPKFEYLRPVQRSGFHSTFTLLRVSRDLFGAATRL